MSIQDYVNRSIYKNRFDVDPSGDLNLDILRIKKEKKYEKQEIAAYSIFTDYYAKKCKTHKEIVELYNKLIVFFKNPDEENDILDMFRKVFFAYISRFEVIPENIKERVREEYNKMKMAYEMSIAVPIVEEIMAKPEK